MNWHNIETEGNPKQSGVYFVYAPGYYGGSSGGKESHEGVMFSAFTKRGTWSIEYGYDKRPGVVKQWAKIEPPEEQP